jgi:hypothetical protein
MSTTASLNDSPRLPPPRDKLAGCVWLARIVAKARLLRSGRLPPDYTSRFGHPGGVDGQFLAFFGLSKEQIVEAASRNDEEVVQWFTRFPAANEKRIEEWNHLAHNLGRPGFPMTDRLPVALSTTYVHLANKNFSTVFEVLEADEKTG